MSKRKRPSQSRAREFGSGPDKHKDRIAALMQAKRPEQYEEFVKWEKNPDRSPVPPHAREARRKATQRTKAKAKAMPVSKRAPGSKSNSPKTSSKSRSVTPYSSRVAFNDKGELRTECCLVASPLPPIDWNISTAVPKERSPRKSASRSPRRDTPPAASDGALHGEAQPPQPAPQVPQVGRTRLSQPWCLGLGAKVSQRAKAGQGTGRQSVRPRGQRRKRPRTYRWTRRESVEVT